MSRSRTFSYIGHLEPARFDQAIRAAAAALGVQLSCANGSAYRIEKVGCCLNLKLKSAGPTTLISFNFARCVRGFWRLFMKHLTAIVQVRRINGAVAMPAAEPRATRDASRSVQDVVNQFLSGRSHGYEVVFSEKALSQAAMCKYRHVHKAERVLEGLRRAADALANGPVVGMSDQDFWNQAVGRAVTLRVSDTQLQMFPGDYHADFAGERFIGHRHVTLGHGWSEADCMSIHWAYCPKRRLIIVTRCGKHGRTHR